MAVKDRHAPSRLRDVAAVAVVTSSVARAPFVGARGVRGRYAAVLAAMRWTGCRR